MTSDYLGLWRLLKPHLRSFRWPLGLLIGWFFLETALTGLRPLIMAPLLSLILHPEAGGTAPTFSLSSLSSLDLNNIGAWALALFGLTGTDNLLRAALLFGGIYCAVTVITSVASYGGIMLATWVRNRLRRLLELDLFRHLLDLPLKYHHEQKGGAMVARLEDDTGEVTRFLDGGLRVFIMSPLLIAFYGTLMIATNPVLALATVAGGGLHLLLTRKMSRPIRQAARHQNWEAANLHAYLHEVLMSIRVVKVFCAERIEIERLRTLFTRILKIQFYDAAVRNLQRPLRALVDALVQFSITLFAVYELSHGRLSAEGFFLFIYVGMSVLGPVSNLAGAVSNLHVGFVALERMRAILTVRSPITDGPETLSGFERGIELRGLAYAYGKVEALERVDLEIRKGEVVALVGPSGGGKSTLIDLLMRFDDPTRGAIIIDGHDIRRFTQDSYRRLFRMVPQESMLFNASLRDNIAYGRQDVSQAALERAASIANAEEFIRRLPNGYDSLVGDRGVKLSGGQRQRIALARALLDNPQVLVLDEATSALDSESERQVQIAIDRIPRTVTTVVIAHRLSTVLHADRIAVLDRGVIIDSGRHDELIGRCPLYQRLCELQFDERLMKSPSPGID